MNSLSSRVYVVSLIDVAITAAETLIQIKAGAACPLKLLRAVLNQRTTTTPTKQRVQINRKSAAGTVTPFTPIKLGPAGDPAAAAVGGAAATGVHATVEGTDTDILVNDIWDFALGWLWLPKANEEIFVGAGGIIGLKLPAAPGGSTIITAEMVFQELS